MFQTGKAISSDSFVEETRHKEDVDDEPPGRIPCHLCQGIGNIWSEYYCKKCQIYLCLECCKNHRERSVYHDHQVAPLKALICSKHMLNHQQFCQKCSTLLCPKCVNEGMCETHTSRISDISEMCPIPEADKLLSRLNQLIAADDKLYKIVNIIDKNINSLANLDQSIKAHAKTLKEKIDKEERALLDEVKEYECKMKDIKENSYISIRQELSNAKKDGIEMLLLILPQVYSKMKTASIPTEKNINAIHFKPKHSVKLGKLAPCLEWTILLWTFRIDKFTFIIILASVVIMSIAILIGIGLVVN